MRRMLFATVLAAAIAPALAAPDSPRALEARRSASGHGTIAFGEHDRDDATGRAYLRFDVRKGGGSASGSLLVAAEHPHGMFPDVVVRMGSIDEASFDGRTVEFTGRGKLHSDPVSVTVFAFDGDGTGEHDTFRIECVDEAGDVVFEAEGELFIGDVTVDFR